MAITIAIIAVILAVVGNHGDDAKTEALVKTTEAANQWAFYQAKSLKEHNYAAQIEILRVQSETAVVPDKRNSLIAKYEIELERYRNEKNEIKTQAEELNKEAQHKLRINDRCDQAMLLLQIGIVICSIAILARLKACWFAGMALGAIGAAIGISSFLV